MKIFTILYSFYGLLVFSSLFIFFSIPLLLGIWFKPLKRMAYWAHHKIARTFFSLIFIPMKISYEEGVDLKKTHGTEGFGIECAVVKGEIKNLKTNLALKWKKARQSAPRNVRIKQTITGPHMLARFSINERPDIYPNDIALTKAYAGVLCEEIEKIVNEGCDYIQFDEPVWTENVKETLWAAEIINDIISISNSVKKINL